jgi:hypothetical protein
MVGYIGKIAVGTTPLGPKIAAGSSPARATKCNRAARANPVGSLHGDCATGNGGSGSIATRVRSRKWK